MPRDKEKTKIKDKKHDLEKDFKKWLEAQIALQNEVLDTLNGKENELREAKEGQIALKEQELKRKHKKQT